jgi:hypothetical protein
MPKAMVIMLARADVIGDPTIERPTDTVGDAVKAQRPDYCRHREAEDRHRGIGDAALMGDRRKLRRRHEAARRHQEEHRIRRPEDRRPEGLLRWYILGALQRLDLIHRGQFLVARRAHEEGAGDDAHAEDDGEFQERIRIATLLDHGPNWGHGERHAGAEARGREAATKPVLVGEPFERVANGGALDRAAGEAGQNAADIELPE